MIEIISPNQFRTIPWKNGKGKTTELAISKNGNMEDFDWRLSIASVIEDGPFSDFSGYDRNLILLDGKGIKLTHSEQHIDVLEDHLSLSSFNGCRNTIGELVDGPILDFNLMTKIGKYNVEVITSIDQKNIELNTNGLYFVYSHQLNSILKTQSEEKILHRGFLAIIRTQSSNILITGSNLIVILLKEV